jgi:hypothetical protein
VVLCKDGLSQEGLGQRHLVAGIYHSPKESHWSKPAGKEGMTWKSFRRRVGVRRGYARERRKLGMAPSVPTWATGGGGSSMVV